MSTDREIFFAFLEAERKARAKHPVFANFFQNEPRSDAAEYRKLLRDLQDENDRDERNHSMSAVNIISEELCEAFMAHYDERNLAHCLSELHQLGGCVISAVRMIEREIQNRKEKHETQKAEVAAARHRGQEGSRNPHQQQGQAPGSQVMKKYDINTRQGRARRVGNTSQFNPDTLRPHSKKFVAARQAEKRSGRHGGFRS